MHTHTQEAVCLEGGSRTPVRDELVLEEPLQIVLNERPFSITMRTPGDDEHLVRGLLLAEGIATPEGLSGEILVRQLDGYSEAVVRIPEVFLCRDVMAERSLLSNASCGFCGKREVADLPQNLKPLQPSGQLQARRIPEMGARMRDHQAGFARTGGCHAAAAFTIGGSFLTLFEDIGRHNAVDKVIGSLAASGDLGTAEVLFVSGRVSFEIVSKAHAAGIPIICAVSAPSSLAVRMSENLGISLLGFCRGDRFTVYSNNHHIDSSPP